MRRAFLLAPLALLFAGCGGGPPHEETVIYENYPLHCLVFDGGGYGKGSGVSCDFERWHKETGH